MKPTHNGIGFFIIVSFLVATSVGLFAHRRVTPLSQNPPAFFVVHGGIANGDQFDNGFPFSADSSTGGLDVSRDVHYGKMSVSASISDTSVQATYSGTMDAVDASRQCNLYYGCGWSPNANTQYSGIDVYVKGEPGTKFHIVHTASGSLDCAVTKTKACSNGWGNAQASAAWAGSPQVNATTEHGQGGYCGIDPPKSGSASVSENHVIDGTSTYPTRQYNGVTYSY